MKTMNELRSILCEQIDRVQSGRVEAKTANSISNSVAKIFQSAKLEMEYAKLHGKVANLSFIKLEGSVAASPVRRGRPRRVATASSK